MIDKTQLPVTRHPGSKRAFRDIHVPKLLDTLRNIKKLSYDCAGQLHEHFVQFANLNSFKHLLTPDYAESAARAMVTVGVEFVRKLWYDMPYILKSQGDRYKMK